MTAIVGVLCRDGLVIGADGSTTFTTGHSKTIEQPVEKISIIGGRAIVAGTGQVGLGQRFARVLDQANQSSLFKASTHYLEAGKQLCAKGIEDFTATNAPKGQYGALVGFSIGDSPHLCEFAITDFQPEFKDPKKIWYVSMGSGQTITDPFLAFVRDVFWSDGPPRVQDGIFAATWALDFAVQVNPGGVNKPVRIAVLEKVAGRFAARILDESELDEHRQNIEQAKERLRTFPASQSADAPNTADIPKPSKPEA